MSWIALAGGRYWKYTVLSTMGSLMSICSTIVIMGPMAQLGYMFDEYRRTATFLYLGSLVLSLILAFTFKSFFVCFLCGILQYGCLTWYSLSYIPYGRETVIALISRN
ncbi:membrane protein involved in ER to golgi family transport [Angomonas deanei]|nr:membrane protein involved in ER to golgi family transport [Angomonas deanei]|eukprot:EPY38370.1 membrane protein involved in ER to golgi family transport [Angomonas deanei]